MGRKRLYIWVEGDDDVRFFDKIIKPKFVRKYNFVEVRPYANLKKGRIGNFLKSIKAMNDDYIYVRDINDSPCVSNKKQKVKDEVRNIDKNRIIVVIKEIESWYLAGLDVSYKIFGVRPFNITDTITKEQFNDMLPTKFDSRIDFMLEILKCFSIEKAKERNKSFKYFIEKYYCES